ncbi:hypothetical protein [Xanthomonas hortorum]|uniref:hypothetical protein n=1 Tax=Xanthomonas hortorum TaxID=56454 RepID=UPI001F306E15|nr:hypothetical protein [Xanthomonas hortorum pv. vitians]
MQLHNSFRSLTSAGSNRLPRAVALALVLVASSASAATGETKVYGTQYARRPPNFE